MKNYEDLDKKIRVNFFSGPIKRNSKSPSQQTCAHVGSIIWDGFNIIKHKKLHRIQCSKCGKRFGKDVDNWNLLLYQEKIKKII